MDKNSNDDVATGKAYKRLHTFHSRAQSFAEAADAHDMVAKAAKDAKLGAQSCEELWSAITVAGVPGADTGLDRAVEATITQDALLLVRTGDDLPAAAAFAIAAKLIAESGDDYRDDLAMQPVMLALWQKLAELDAAAATIEEGFGCDRSDAWHTVRDVRSAPNSAQFRRKMEEICRLAGAMHAAMCQVGGLVDSDDPHEVTGVTQGRDLERLTPAEHARLADPLTADMQAMRVLRGQADVYELHGKVTKNRGPLVLLVDESGSMHDEHQDYRGRNTWAKAAALSLARIALEQGRAVACVHFGTATTVQEVPDHAALVEMCRSFVGGGTAFVPALKQAAKVAARREPKWQGADIVAITDGEDGGGDRDELNAVIDDMAKVGTRIWDVAIGQEHDADFPLRARAEKYVFAHDNDLRLRKAAVTLAVGLTGAATKVAREDLN